MMLSTRKNSLNQLIYIFGVILLLINFLALKSTILGLILALLWLIYASKQTGNIFLNSKYNLINYTVGSLILIGILIIINSAFFYIFNLNNFSISIITILISILILFISKLKPPTAETIIQKIIKTTILIKNFSIKKILIKTGLASAYTIIYIILLKYLFDRSTVEALTSPWQIISKIFFILYFISTFILLLFIILPEKNKKLNPQIKYITKLIKPEEFPAVKIILISLHCLLTLSIAIIVYKIGFGFDPFVHRASEQALSSLGYLSPKPLYYIGQYSLVVFLSKISLIKISIIDKLLVPISASLLLPAIGYFYLKKLLNHKTLILISIMAILSFTVSYFFYTVPQSLANLLFTLLVLITAPYIIKQKPIPSWSWLVGLSCLLIHPISGTAAIILLFLTLISKCKKNKLNTILKIIYFVLASLSIPLLFTINHLLSNNFSIEFLISNLKQIQSLFPHLLSYIPFYSIYHQIYLLKYNLPVILLVIFTIGIYFIIKKNKQKNNNFGIIVYIQFITILVINFILVSIIKFNNVIDYEQLEYPKRLLQIIFLTAIPLIIAGIYYISNQIKRFQAGTLILILIISSMATTALYLSYPHTNAFEKNRGYSVSMADLKAVEWINQDANNNDYLVLSNQATSAASLARFGFKKYYPSQISPNQKLFYYPIPTSSPLYRLYLNMVYQGPDLKYIDQARAITDVNTIYFTINHYWLDSDKIVEQAKPLANDIKNIDNKIWIFKFK